MPAPADPLRRLLHDVADGRLTAERGWERLKHLPFEDLGYAKLDHHRAIRQGFPEIILGQGKTRAQTVALAEKLFRRAGRVFISRTDAAVARALRARKLPARHLAEAKAVVVQRAWPATAGRVLVLTAGTADIPAAEEAVLTARLLGAAVERIYDVGVAGIHRLLARRHDLAQARAIVVAAGMDGALPSVVGGLAPCPVIALPTSTGYGAGAGGVAALLTMLNACAPNVVTVNIDDGVGAGFTAGLINRREP